MSGTTNENPKGAGEKNNKLIVTPYGIYGQSKSMDEMNDKYRNALNKIISITTRKRGKKCD